MTNRNYENFSDEVLPAEYQPQPQPPYPSNPYDLNPPLYDPTNPYQPQNPEYRDSAQSLPSAAGFAADPNPVMGVPVVNDRIPPNQGFQPNPAPNRALPYRGDGYYNPDVVVVGLRRGRRRVLITFLVVLVVAVCVFTLFKILVFH